MRLSVLTAAFLVAGGIGCSSIAATGSSTVGPTSTAGDNSDARRRRRRLAAAAAAVATWAAAAAAAAAATDMGPIGPGPWPLDDLTIYGARRRPRRRHPRRQPRRRAEHLGRQRRRRSTSCARARRRSRRSPPRTACTSGRSPIRTAAERDAHHRHRRRRRADEVFVGYYGYETLGNPYIDTDAQKELGNGDRVTVDARRQARRSRACCFRCDSERGNGCWENRSPRRIIYAHTGVAAGHSLWGFNHGVSHVLGDEFGDHVHPEIWYRRRRAATATEKLGEFYGIAVTPPATCGWRAATASACSRGIRSRTALADGRTMGARGTSSTPSPPTPAITSARTAVRDGRLPREQPRRGRHPRRSAVAGAARRRAGVVGSGDAQLRHDPHWGQVPSDLMDVQADPDGTLVAGDLGRRAAALRPGVGRGARPGRA